MWLMFLAGLTVEAPERGPAILPVWMSGCWEEVSEDSWTEECWTEPRGSMMMGSSRTGKGQRLLGFEHMRIEGDDSEVEFCALPNGQEGGCFPRKTQSKSEIVFENPAHDYPQRIRYWREAKYLIAETALSDGSRARRWRYLPKR